MTRNNLLSLNLHMFDGEAGAGDNGTAAESNQPGTESLEGVVYGKQNGTANEHEPGDRRAEFDRLMRNEFKKEFDAKVNAIVQNRLKDDRKARSAKSQPLMALLAQKYGGDPTSDSFNEDVLKAIQDDSSFWEREAMERGLTVDQLKQMKRLEAENAEFRAIAEEQQNKQKAEAIIAEGEALKQIYPSFDIETEMENPDLINLLNNGIDLRTAFEVLHKDEIIGGAMQYTAQMIQQKTINDIKARGLRPSENGTRSNASASYKPNVADLTDADMDEVIRRVRRGERISF